MAELQERSRAFDLAIENIYTRTRRVLARHAGLDYNSPRSEIAARIASRSTIDAHKLETLMRQCEAGHQRRTAQLAAVDRSGETIARGRNTVRSAHAFTRSATSHRKHLTKWRRKPTNMPETVAATVEHIQNELRKVIVGQDDAIEQILIALLAEGHALVEGVPGTAKTLTVKTLSRIINASFSRIQFTPDLMPSDITGTNVFNIADLEFQPAAWSNFYGYPARRRNQSHAAKNAGGIARSDGRTPGDDRRRRVPASADLYRAGHREPDRIRRNLSAA